MDGPAPFWIAFGDRWERSESLGRQIGSHVFDFNGKWSVGPRESDVNRRQIANPASTKERAAQDVQD